MIQADTVVNCSLVKYIRGVPRGLRDKLPSFLNVPIIEMGLSSAFGVMYRCVSLFSLPQRGLQPVQQRHGDRWRGKRGKTEGNKH